MCSARGDLAASRRVRLLSLAVGLEATDPSDATAVDFARFLEDFDGLLIDLGELRLAREVALLTVGSRRKSLARAIPISQPPSKSWPRRSGAKGTSRKRCWSWKRHLPFAGPPLANGTLI